MSDPAEFALVKDRRTTYYTHRWVGEHVVPKLAWGSEVFCQWLSSCHQTGQWDDCGRRDGAVVDLDNHRVTWRSEHEFQQPLRCQRIIDKLLAAAWPGFEIRFAEYHTPQLAEAHGWDSSNWKDNDPLPDPNHEAKPISSSEFCASWNADTSFMDAPDEPPMVVESVYVNEAGELLAERKTQQDIAHRAIRFEDEELRTWVTVVTIPGSPIQLQTRGMPGKFLHADLDFVEHLRHLPPTEIPAEELLSEGIIIDAVKQRIHLWGRRSLQAYLPILRASWIGWSVGWLDGGYIEHCQHVGVEGHPWNDAAALSRVSDWILADDEVGPSDPAIRQQQLNRTIQSAGLSILNDR